MGKRGGGGQERHEAAELLETVRDALRGLAAVPEDGLDDALDAAASLLAAAPAGPRAVSRALLRAAEELARRAWEYGWQPADVVRLMRREPDAATGRFVADAIAAEARRYAPESLDARWSAQLAAVGAAQVWWVGDGDGDGGGDESYLESLAGRERLSRFETVAGVLGALRRIARLPRITPVGPLPGAAARVRPVPAPDGAAPGPRQLGRIRALLAKAESTEFAEEAEALSAKAQELMARHSIDAALLAAGAGALGEAGEGPDACRIGVEGPYEPAKALLLDAVAEANHCRAVWSAEFDFSTVVGFASDLELVELMYTSLLVQATAAMRRAGDEHHARGRSRRTRDFRESFLIAYAGRIRDRLVTAAEEAAEEVAAEEPTEVLPVLAARDVAVGESAERLFPATTSHRLKGRDAAGWAHGRAAADAAMLHRR
ncbi:DUF2786 domain-containing protein [Streptomyces sp. NPDC057654]|uniref:DUF2786 domain-containing protein n=1 Tax=Streptomyces sp. NPDC057654 TaxID=3346196 RepID=UPI00369413DD